MISYHDEGVLLPERGLTPEAWIPTATPVSPSETWAVVTAERGLNVCAGPNLNASIVGTLRLGTCAPCGQPGRLAAD